MFLEGMTRMAFGFGGGGRSSTLAIDPPRTAERRRPKVGLALGSGAARGWAHIGVLEALAEHGVAVDVIAGTSIGAVAGGCVAAGKLAELREFAMSLTRSRVVGLMDLHYGPGLIGGLRLRAGLEKHLGDARVEDLPNAFAAIATELQTGHEVWLTRGRLVDAICASYALPGVFDPVQVGGRWLMDGALVNPVPVSTARALGADVVIAVNLNGDLSCKGSVIHSHGTAPGDAPLAPDLDTPRSFGAQVKEAAGRINPFQKRDPNGPRLAGVMIDAFNITQDRIARSRLAGDPPDIMIAPRCGRIGLFEFQRAAEAIETGREAIERVIEEIRVATGQAATVDA